MKLMRCKFQIHQVDETFYQNQPKEEPMVKVKMGAVYQNEAGNPHNACSENHIFGKSTPQGAFEATIRNPDVCALLKAHVGRQVYLDFTLAD